MSAPAAVCSCCACRRRSQASMHGRLATFPSNKTSFKAQIIHRRPARERPAARATPDRFVAAARAPAGCRKLAAPHFDVGRCSSGGRRATPAAAAGRRRPAAHPAQPQRQQLCLRGGAGGGCGHVRRPAAGIRQLGGAGQRRERNARGRCPRRRPPPLPLLLHAPVRFTWLVGPEAWQVGCRVRSRAGLCVSAGLVYPCMGSCGQGASTAKLSLNAGIWSSACQRWKPWLMPRDGG